MKILFFGCDDIAAVSLKKLAANGITVVGLVTQPDRPKGRGLHETVSPTKAFAMASGIDVFQPDTLKDPSVVARLKSYDADVFVVVAYGKFLPEPVLALPKYGCVNMHPSLLPRYRGAAPINWAVINGDAESGVTLMKMNAAMDGGDIVAQIEHPITRNMTAVTLRTILAELGAALLVEMLPRLVSGQVILRPQDSRLATRAPKMDRELGHINWTKTSKQIHDLVRGTQPWPGAYTLFRGQPLKIVTTVVPAIDASGKSVPATSVDLSPGAVVLADKNGLWVRTGDGILCVTQVHPASSKLMEASAFCAGHKPAVGELLS